MSEEPARDVADEPAVEPDEATRWFDEAFANTIQHTPAPVDTAPFAWPEPPADVLRYAVMTDLPRQP